MKINPALLKKPRTFEGKITYRMKFEHPDFWSVENPRQDRVIKEVFIMDTVLYPTTRSCRESIERSLIDFAGGEDCINSIKLEVNEIEIYK